MFYYEIHVLLGEDSYSFVLSSEIELDDNEVIRLAEIENQFQEKWDSDDAMVETITEEEFNEKK